MLLAAIVLLGGLGLAAAAELETRHTASDEPALSPLGLHRRYLWGKSLRSTEGAAAVERMVSSGAAVFMPLKHRTVLSGHRFNSPAYNAERWRHLRGRSLATSSNAALLPTAGAYNGIGEYFVTIEMGTPSQQSHVIFDTGSSVLWFSCECIQCPATSTTITLRPFDPSKSTTDQQVACGSNECNTLSSDNSNNFGNTCGSSSTTQCSFSIKYGGNGTASGPVLTDTMSLQPFTGTTPVTAKVAFGCARIQTGDLLRPTGAMDGLMGMGRTGDSALAQFNAAQKLPFAFSFCLDGTDFTGSHVVFGRGPVPATLTTTPLVEVAGLPFYYLGLTSIQMGSYTLAGSDSIQQVDSLGNGGIILDSGTTFTVLPTAVYSELLQQLQQVADFSAPDPSQLGRDCTVLSASMSLSSFPTIDMVFSSVSWPVPPSSYLIESYQYQLTGETVYCLGALAGSLGNVNAIIGDSFIVNNFVLVDIENSQVGWSPLNCSTGEYFGSPNTPPQPPFPPGANAPHPAPPPSSSFLPSPSPQSYAPAPALALPPMSHFTAPLPLSPGPQPPISSSTPFLGPAAGTPALLPPPPAPQAAHALWIHSIVQLLGVLLLSSALLLLH